MEYIRILCENNKFDVNAKSQGSEDELDNYRSNRRGFHSYGKSACCCLKYLHLFRGRARTRGLFPRLLCKT